MAPLDVGTWPIKQADAEIKDGRVQAHQLVLEADLVRPPCIGIRRTGAAGSLNAQVTQLALTTGQTPTDLPERMRPPSRQNSITTSCPQ
jgi:hypothetical protein